MRRSGLAGTAYFDKGPVPGMSAVERARPSGARKANAHSWAGLDRTVHARGSPSHHNHQRIHNTQDANLGP